MSLIELVEIKNSSKEYDPASASVKSGYSLKSLYLNPEYVMFLKENSQLNGRTVQGPLVPGLDPSASFTQLAVHVPGQAPMLINVVGSPESVKEKLASVG
jgi:hypothetical protein